jgi:hypothetical protein
MGISFDDASGNMIVNYPKQHIANGEAKNAADRTNGRYKQTVRMFKNARGCAVDRGLLGDDVAPSYFVECLLYNVPDLSFVANRQQSFSNVWRYLWEQIQPDSAVCQNEQIPLFGTSGQQDRVKQYIGHAVRQIMEACGYRLDRQGIRITRANNLFTSGSRYAE